jgi:hypothetical protein
MTINKLTEAVRTQLGQQVDAADIGAGANVAKVLAQVVAESGELGDGQRANPYTGAARLGEALFQSGAIKDLADGAVLLEATQRLSRAAKIQGDFIASVDAALSAEPAAELKPGQLDKLIGVLSGPGGDLGATLSAERQHQTFLVSASTWGVDIGEHPEALKPGSAGKLKAEKKELNTQYDVSGRTGLIDFNVLRDNARASSNDEGKQPFRRALDDARRGTQAAQQAVAYYFKEGAVPSPGNARLAAQTLADPLAQGAPALLLDKDSRTALVALLRQANEALRAFESERPRTAEQAKAIWDRFPNARGLAETEQLFWLQYDLGKQEHQKTGKSARKFNDLSPDNQVQNLRSTVVALLGSLDADNLLRGVLNGSTKLTPELGELLQAHLDQASQQAIQAANGQGDYALASAIHARAVATQQLVQILAFGHEFGRHYSEDQAAKIFTALYDAAKEAGDRYGMGGPEGGASGASKVAVKHIGNVLEAMFPERKGDFGKWGHQLLDESSFTTELQMMEKLGIHFDGDGEAFKTAIGTTYKDNWGIADILKIIGVGRQFSDEELFGFYGIMTTLNNTWASQQGGRAIEETAAGKDDSRVQSDKRGGVYQPYLFMLKLLNNAVETGLRMSQDHMEGLKKAGILG